MFIDTIDGKINGFKCKYVYLDKLFNGKLDEKRGKTKIIDTVNIFISLESLFYSIRQTTIEKHLNKMEKKEIRSVYRQIISNIINVSAHYRNYFSRHHVKSNIIYYFNEVPDTESKYNNSAIWEDYRYHYYESLNSMDRMNINNMIRESIQFIRIITEYIEDVYMVGTTHVESSMVPFTFMMENFLPCNVNIIVTKDSYDFQYCTYNSLVITRQGMEPVLLTKKNLMKYLMVVNDMNVEETRVIHHKLLTFILACRGDKKRSLETSKGLGFKTIYKQLLALYEAGYLLDDDPDTMSLQSLMHVFNKNGKFKYLQDAEEEIKRIIAKYHVIDFETQYRVINKTQKKQMEIQLTNKTDPGALVEINERYFSDYPLQLMELNQFD